MNVSLSLFWVFIFFGFSFFCKWAILANVCRWIKFYTYEGLLRVPVNEPKLRWTAKLCRVSKFEESNRTICLVNPCFVNHVSILNSKKVITVLSLLVSSKSLHKNTPINSRLNSRFQFQDLDVTKRKEKSEFEKETILLICQIGASYIYDDPFLRSKKC